MLGSALAIPGLALAEIAPRQAEVIGHAATVCSAIVSKTISDPAGHPSGSNFNRDAASGMWFWAEGNNQVAVRKVIEGGVTYCDVIIVSPSALDADIQRVALGFALEKGYRVTDGSAPGELMIAASDANVFLVRSAAPGWRINFEP